MAGTLLDQFMSGYDFNEVHATIVHAPPDRIVRAIKELRPNEIFLFRTLAGIRYLPARLAGRRGLGFVASQSLWEQMSREGFVLLAETDSELVLGSIGQPWKLLGGPLVSVAGAEEFLALDRPGYAKVAMNFRIDDSWDGDGVRLSTETRISVPDPTARKKFAVYWFLIRRGSGFIRRTALRAIKRRAERC